MQHVDEESFDVAPIVILVRHDHHLSIPQRFLQVFGWVGR
jgi:hypothetical protein